MPDISEARQALRDFARTEVVVFTPQDGEELPRAEQVELGALAHQPFLAVQAALTVAEELRAEGKEPPLSVEDIDIKLAKLFAADRIEAAVLKALGS